MWHSCSGCCCGDWGRCFNSTFTLLNHSTKLVGVSGFRKVNESNLHPRIRIVPTHTQLKSVKLRSQRVCFCTPLLPQPSWVTVQRQWISLTPVNMWLAEKQQQLFLYALLNVTISFYAFPNKYQGAFLSPPSSSRLAGFLKLAELWGIGRGREVRRCHNVAPTICL